MENKYKICVLIFSIVVSFAAGRYSIKQTTTTEQVKIKTDTDEKTNTHTVITTIKQPTGEIKTVETIDTVTQQDTKTNESIDSKTVQNKRSVLNISALAAIDATAPLIGPKYGISISKEFIGPITLGVFGFIDKTIGVSVGVNF